MPFALVRLCQQAVELVVSFETPELRFKKDTEENRSTDYTHSDWSLVRIG